MPWRTLTERRPEPPIALVEEQGYAADAFRRAAALIRLLGDPEQADRLTTRSNELMQKLDQSFWLAEDGVLCHGARPGQAAAYRNVFQSRTSAPHPHNQ